MLEQLDRQLRELVRKRDRLDGWDRAEVALEIDQLLERRHKYQHAPAA